MSQANNHDTSNISKDDQPSNGAKKPYQTPGFEVEEVFERTALGCVKASAGACGAGPVQS